MRMKHRWFAAGFSLMLASVLGWFAYSSNAQNAGAEVFVLASTTATCERTGQPAPAGFQDESLGLVLRQFWDNEFVYISFTFPDGRTFSPQVADGRVQAPAGLDGLVDMPANFPWFAQISNGGDYYYTFQASKRWPYGSYTFTALGATSRRQTQGCFVLLPRQTAAPNPGPATLIIEDNTTGANTSLQGAMVNIFGRGFRAQEEVSLWITAPDGTVLDYPGQFTSDVGSFASTFVFDSRFPIGNYGFTALGRTSGYQVITRFQLNGQTSTPSGWALLRVAWRPNAAASQNQTFELQGQFFEPFELVAVWATLPDGSVRDLPFQQANQFGEFFAEIGFDQRLPTGNYAFTVQGQSSRRLVIGRVDVNPGSPNITAFDPAQGQAPGVVDSNSGLPFTLGDVQRPLGINQIELAPEFLSDSQPPPVPTATPIGPTF